MAGKGSAPRKGANQKAYESNWDKIFKKPEPKEWVHFCRSGHLWLDEKFAKCDICGAQK